MNAIDVIRMLCKKEGTSLKALEKELGYSNGSLAKAKVIPSDRILEISKYFNVSMEYLTTGEESAEKPEIPDYDKDTMELIILFSKLKKEQKSAILNMMRSFALEN